MKHIFLNLKRFDVPASMGGVNRGCEFSLFGAELIKSTRDGLKAYPDVDFTVYLPEAHLLSAKAEKEREASPLKLGCQGVYREDIKIGGPFGAFTTNRPASAAVALGCESVLIGHCEERGDKLGILAEAGVVGKAASEAVSRILNKEIKCASARGLHVLYCIGEKSEEVDVWKETLATQLEIALDGVDKSLVTIAYEPVWSIGPGRSPADAAYIKKVASFVKAETGGLEVVYGGGLKRENAKEIASVKEIDGGLIALTRFTGEIGFYSEEYLEIIRLYLEN